MLAPIYGSYRKKGRASRLSCIAAPAESLPLDVTVDVEGTNISIRTCIHIYIHTHTYILFTRRLYFYNSEKFIAAVVAGGEKKSVYYQLTVRYFHQTLANGRIY